MGFGTYHSGVQVGSTEYTFAGGSGIFTHEPKGANAKFRESIVLGEFNGTSRDIDRVIDELKSSFPGSAYNLLNKNCNHFANAFTTRLINKPIPDFVNRLAGIGSYFSCLLPPSMTGQAPVNENPSQSSGYMVSGRQAKAVSSSSNTQVFESKGYKLGQGNL